MRLDEALESVADAGKLGAGVVAAGVVLGAVAWSVLSVLVLLFANWFVTLCILGGVIGLWLTLVAVGYLTRALYEAASRASPSPDTPEGET